MIKIIRERKGSLGDLDDLQVFPSFLNQEEIEQCIKFLKKQIEIISPRILLLLGRTAVKGLLPDYQKQTIDSLRDLSKSYGNIRFQDIPVMVTYHPSAILRSPSNGQKALADFRFLEAIKREFDEIDPLL